MKSTQFLSNVIRVNGHSMVQPEKTDMSENKTGLTDGIFGALRLLDQRLMQAIEAAENAYGAAFAVDQFRGLHLSEGDVARLLGREPGSSPLGLGYPLVHAGAPDQSDRFRAMAGLFGLTDFDLGLLLIGLAPEIDLRYERLYAYLQDDVTRKRPSVDLALNLLTTSAGERLAVRRYFLPEAPLIRHRLIGLADEPGCSSSPLLAKTIQIDPRMVEYLLGSEALPADLLDYVQVSTPRKKPEEVLLAEDTRRALLHLCDRKPAEIDRHTLYFDGPRGVGRQSAAEMVCTRLGKPLLCADLARLESLDDHSFAETLRRMVRESVLRNAALYLRNFDLLLVDAMSRRLARSVAILADAGLTFLAGNTPWEPADIFQGRRFFRVAMARPEFTDRVGFWQRQLNAALPTEDLEKAAAKFKFTGGQIRDAAVTAERMAQWRDQDHPQMTATDLFEACRRQSNQKLSRLAQKIVPRYAWNDIVLPDDQVAQFREICNQSVYRPVVLGAWGFENKLSYGKGLNVLFSGPPGTGKTMAAEVIAHELMLDLYRIDLSQVVSKYIGETEKNLDRIFSEAQTSNAILFFDEADALFGKRSEVKDAHDRYANIETGYLLQKMEEYDGIAILATNLRGNMDEAFVRRMNFCVEFPFPQERERRLIWEKVWPVATPRMPGLQLERMAREFEISGGSIKNIALAAAFMAADDGGVIDLSHLMRAARREYQKMGKVMMGGEFDEGRPFTSAS